MGLAVVGPDFKEYKGSLSDGEVGPTRPWRWGTGALETPWWLKSPAAPRKSPPHHFVLVGIIGKCVPP